MKNKKNFPIKIESKLKLKLDCNL